MNDIRKQEYLRMRKQPDTPTLLWTNQKILSKFKIYIRAKILLLLE